MALAGPGARAETFLVPLLPGAAAGAESVRLFVSNLDPEKGHSVKVRTHGLWTPIDDTAEWQRFGVPSGKTRVIDLPVATAGVVEVELAPAHRLTAERRGPGAAFQVPVVAFDPLAASAGPIVLQGFQEGDGANTGLALTNLDGVAAHCTVAALTAAGSTQASGLVTLAPRSFGFFPDVAGNLGVASARDGRLELRCAPEGGDETAARVFAFGQRTGDGEARFLLPAAAARGTGGGGGGGEPGELEVENLPDGSVAFRVAGHIHEGTHAEPTRTFNVPLQPNTGYSRVELSFDVFHGGWLVGQEAATYSLVWLHRGGIVDGKWPKWRSNVYGFVNAFGGHRSGVKVMTNVDRNDARDSWTEKVGLRPGTTYHVTYVWNAVSRTFLLEVFDKATGAKVVSLPGSTLGKPLRTDDLGMFLVYFGHEDATGIGPERPGIGWRWSDLEGRFVK